MEREGRSEAWAENPTVLSGTEGLFDQALFGEGKEAEIPLGLDNLGRGTGLGTRLSRDPEVGGSEQICPISWPQVDLRTRPLGCPGERHQGSPGQGQLLHSSRGRLLPGPWAWKVPFPQQLSSSPLPLTLKPQRNLFSIGFFDRMRNRILLQ